MMKRKRVRVLSLMTGITLGTVLIMGELGWTQVSAKTQQVPSPNVAILENMLVDRPWVEETLLGDAFPEDNPYAYENNVYNQNYIYEDILSRYKDDDSLAA